MPRTSLERPRQVASGSENENLMAALSYLLFFVSGIIFLILEKNNRFVRFHAMQSTLTFSVIFIVIVLLSFVPVVGLVVNAIVYAVAVVVWIILMLKAFAGEYYKLPYFGNLAENQLKRLK